MMHRITGIADSTALRLALLCLAMATWGCDDAAKKNGTPFFGMEFPQEDTKSNDKAQCILLPILPKQDKTNDDKCINKVFKGNRLGDANRLAVYSTSRA